MTKDDFIAAALRNPVNTAIMRVLRETAVPDAWVVAGCLTQSVWNVRTGRPIDHGINDYDIFYFDPDTSWDAEDAVIRRITSCLHDIEAKVEVRNQARVHLWYPAKHGRPYSAVSRSTDGIDRFLTVNTQVGLRPVADGYELYAPKGLGDIAQMIVRPNHTANFSATNYIAKAERWKALWPEITVIVAED
ncbi:MULTISPECIES: nucleotidyltransferase family protein [unclassified Bradyrhizobium]|uniref:nucleotidyltransferase family protein n=1 Tax=unclassified Bradyrhizobium TaxID=2631580 RepID=UPI0028E9C307|nr:MULTISPECIES: nucleotidyltransferase family protein [unclassified Bradyrhizobium]